MKRLACVMLMLTVAPLACKKEEPPPPPPVTAAPMTAPPTTQPPLGVSVITLGNAIGADKKVTTPSETFAAKDTIYASVDTVGTGHAKLRALWSFVKGEKTAKVDETTIEYDATGPTTNEFHIAKPSGWPKGDYKVEIFMNDGAAPAMSRTFKVS